jgi:hypothetical protein
MAEIVPPHRNDPIQSELDQATDQMRGWMETVSSLLNEGQNLSTLEDTGSPEGAVEAIKDRRYRNTATDDIYLKTTDSGDTGWILV